MVATPPTWIEAAKLWASFLNPVRVFVLFLPRKQVTEFSRGVCIRHLHQLIVFLSDQLSSSFTVSSQELPFPHRNVRNDLMLSSPVPQLAVYSPTFQCLCLTELGGELQRNEVLHSSGKKCSTCHRGLRGQRGQHCTSNTLTCMVLYYSISVSSQGSALTFKSGCPSGNQVSENWKRDCQ